jgi:hypothetical protein
VCEGEGEGECKGECEGEGECEAEAEREGVNIEIILTEVIRKFPWPIFCNWQRCL